MTGAKIATSSKRAQDNQADLRRAIAQQMPQGIAPQAGRTGQRDGLALQL